MGHLSRNCPVRGQAVPVESHSKRSKGNETKKDGDNRTWKNSKGKTR